MHRAGFVHHLQRVADVGHEVIDRLEAHDLALLSAALEVARQGLTVDVLHRQEEIFLFFAQAVDLDQVLVPDL